MRRSTLGFMPVAARWGRAVPLAAVLLASAAACAPPPRAAGPLPHEAFVWQRAWTPEVLNAAQTRGGLPLDGLVVLAAELAWDSDGRPRTTRIAFEPSVGPAALAIRVETPTSWDDPGPLATLAAELVGSHAPGELMLDLDAPESRLDAYARWVAAVRAAVRARSATPGTPATSATPAMSATSAASAAPAAPANAATKLTITALPAWLSNPRAFRRLARATDGFVLQVHSLEPPSGPGRPVPLCDPVRARAWIEEAARAGVPFRVALPAYGYRARYDRNGKLLGLSADAPRDGSPDEVIADPVAMAGLVRDLTADRPDLLRGITWFRLPVPGDANHWTARTLAEVIAGRVPRATLRGSAARSASGSYDLALSNDGTADARVSGLRLTWTGRAALTAADAVGGFSLENVTTDTALFMSEPAALVHAEERRVVGWVRFDGEPGTVTVSVDETMRAP